MHPALQFLPFVAMYLATVFTTVAIRCRDASGLAWVGAGATAVLILAASTLHTVAVGKTVAEEWREAQPRGRGYRIIGSLDRLLPSCCQDIALSLHIVTFQGSRPENDIETRSKLVLPMTCQQEPVYCNKEVHGSDWVYPVRRIGRKCGWP